MSASAWQGCSSLVSALMTCSLGVISQICDEALLSERANHDGVDPALEVARHVVDGLPVRVHDVGGNLDDVAAELAHADGEGHARAQRRLFEEQPDVPPIEGGGRRRLHALDPLALQLGRQLETLRERIGIEIENGQEVLHGYVRYSALILTYSAERSHVHTVAVCVPPAPRLTSIARSLPVR